VSHWLIFLFAGLSYDYFLSICRHLLNASQLYIPAILFFAFPTLIAQTVFLSSDIIFICFFLGALNSYLHARYRVAYILLSLILLISLRAVPLIIAFYITLQIVRYSTILNALKITAQFIAIATPWIAWNIYHYVQTGWIIYNTNSIWSAHRSLLTLSGIAMQTGAFFFRLCEYGFVLVWFLLLQNIKKSCANTSQKFLWTLLSAWLFCFFLLSVPFNNPISNRYLLPAYVCGLLLLSAILAQCTAIKKNLLLLVFSLTMLASHFYIYPERFVKAAGYSWDCTLAALPYFNQLAPQIQHYIQTSADFSNGKTVMAGMPAYQSTEFSHLSVANTNTIQQLTDNTHLSGDYFIYSNIMNDIAWEQSQELLKSWVLIYAIKAGSIYIQVYQRPLLQ
ncbi:MAG: hypothetical protein ACK4IY_03195, partial [Chitinophagales bacterium]